MPIVIDLEPVKIKTSYRSYGPETLVKKDPLSRLGKLIEDYFNRKSIGRTFTFLFLLFLGTIVVPGTTYLLVNKPQLETPVEASESLVRLRLTAIVSQNSGNYRFVEVTAYPDGNQLCGADLKLSFSPQEMKLIGVYFPRKEILSTILPLDNHLEFNQDQLLRQANDSGLIDLTVLTYNLESSTQPTCLPAETGQFELAGLVFEIATTESALKFEETTKVKIFTGDVNQSLVNICSTKPYDSVGLWLSPELQITK